MRFIPFYKFGIPQGLLDKMVRKKEESTEYNEVNQNFMSAGGRHTLKIEGVAPYIRV